MAKHNPKLNPCAPYQRLGFGISLEVRRAVADQLLRNGCSQREVRKSLALSGRQVRKAVNSIKHPTNV